MTITAVDTVRRIINGGTMLSFWMTEITTVKASWFTFACLADMTHSETRVTNLSFGNIRMNFMSNLTNSYVLWKGLPQEFNANTSGRNKQGTFTRIGPSI
ncbi:hypothetical protein PUN28_008813 [Cardiocondyla obscurior]|uniref:Uncharacterized protein n=1 Tax=Cardiocondyla obscurior TaxID=286306 RepID=A0AAW2FQI9_9HYME